MKATTLKIEHTRGDVGAIKERLCSSLGRIVAAVEAGMGAGMAPMACLGQAMRRRGFAAPVLPDGLSLPRTATRLDCPITPVILFGKAADREGGCLEAPSARLVACGVKPACVQHGAETEMARVLDGAYRWGLVALLSPTETVLLRDQDRGGFSHFAQEVRAAQPGSGGWRELIIARDERQAILAWLGLTFGWDALLGAALGFPPCCIRHFVTHWDRVCAEHHGDPAELLVAQAPPQPLDWRLNVLGRYQGRRLLEHFPCHWRCAPSRQLARRYARALARHDPLTLRRLRQGLRCPYLVAPEQGIFAFPGAAVRAAPNGWHIRYDAKKLQCTLPRGPLFESIRAAGSLDAAPTRLTVCGQHYEGRLLIFR